MRYGKMDAFIQTTLDELRSGEDVFVSCSDEAEARRVYDAIAEQVSPAQLNRLNVSPLRRRRHTQKASEK